METNLRKKMEQVKELFSDCTDVFQELLTVKAHLTEKIDTYQSSVKKIRSSVDMFSSEDRTQLDAHLQVWLTDRQTCRNTFFWCIIEFIFFCRTCVSSFWTRRSRLNHCWRKSISCPALPDHRPWRSWPITSSVSKTALWKHESWFVKRRNKGRKASFRLLKVRKPHSLQVNCAITWKLIPKLCTFLSDFCFVLLSHWQKSSSHLRNGCRMSSSLWMSVLRTLRGSRM